MKQKKKIVSDSLSAGNGKIKIWKQPSDLGGPPELVFEKPNMVLYQGADVLANCLAGKQNSAITHMYFGFHNGPTFWAPTITKADTKATTFDGYSAPFGYLRVPLNAAPTFISDPNYDGNIAVFSSTLTAGTSEAGATFTPGTSYVYEVALVNESVPNDKTKDRIFSRANFTPIQFVSSYNLIVAWSVKFVS